MIITGGLWLLIICTSNDGRNCDYRGGVSTVLVPEVQCRAALKTGKALLAMCLSPDGRWVVE